MIAMRSEKTTRNQDDFRVMMTGSLIAIFLMVFMPYIIKGWDYTFTSRPFMTATLEVVSNSNGDPYLLYDVDAIKEVDGSWIASIVSEEGIQLLTRRGTGSYNAQVDEPRRWTWFAFFDNEKGLNSPGVPNVPFRICVRYIVEARLSEIQDETPSYCSNLFNPVG